MLVPKVAKYFAAIRSTNTALIEDLEAGHRLSEGSVYLTYAQTAGRGQGTNTWHASPGDNLTLSLLLRPEHLSVDRLFALNELASLSVALTLQHFLPPHLSPAVRIKWPNDVYVADRKIAGILVQNALRGSHVQWAVVGIGLNVNESAFPPELRSRATSLTQLLHEPVSVEDVTYELLTRFTDLYPQLQNPRLSQLHLQYVEHLYRRNEITPFTRRDSGNPFCAYVLGVSPDGKLILRHPGGSTEQCDMRSVAWRSN